MAVHGKLLAIISAIAIAGCCSYLREHPVVISATGQKLCARHRIPLLTVHGYGVTDYAQGSERTLTLIHTFGPQFEREQCNPNYIPRNQSLKRSKDYPIPILVTYCPKCEDATWISEAEWRDSFRKQGMSEQEIQRILSQKPSG